MNMFKRITGFILAMVMLLLCSCSAQVEPSDENSKKTEQVKYNEPAGLVKKTETVYVNLDNVGNVTQTIVSDWLHTTKSKVYVDDVTNLPKFQNITDDSEPDVNGPNLRWYMNATDLYYQGKSDEEVPLKFQLSYKFNGEPIKPEELVGKSGFVEITVKMINTDDYVVKVNGKDVVMYNPMIVIGGISFSEAKFQNISVKNGKTIGNGSSQLAVFAGFPGLNESLGLSDLTQKSDSETQFSFDDTFVVSANAVDFEIGNFMFAALPIDSLDIGLNSISTSMDDVRENLAKLQSVQQSLQRVDADKLLNTLTSNPGKLDELSDLVAQAATLYEENKALIEVLNNFATPQNMQTIQVLTDYISTADFAGLEEALKVLNSFFGDDESSAKIQEGLALLEQMSKDFSDPEVKRAIDNLPQTIATLSALQDAIDENQDLIVALQSLANSDVFSTIESALSGVEGSIAVGGLSQFANFTGDADDITAKMTAWIELGKRYTIFTRKAKNMSSSVMFVYKVDSLKSTSDVVENMDTVPEAEENTGLKAIFKKIFG